jgi:putative nucleotidyltransferase-like protein
VRAILLKGPALAKILYDDEESRPYGDVDLLISPADLSRAEGVLGELGFQKKIDDIDFPGHEPLHGLPWVRAGDELAAIDLHTTLPGASAERSVVWDALSAQPGIIDLDGAQMEVLAGPATALHVALHAAHHGASATQPLEDLKRAIARLPVATWEEATDVALRIGAMPALSAGLRLWPKGAALAERLALPQQLTIEQALKAQSGPRLAAGLLRLRQADGLRAKLAIAARALVPSTHWMRWWSPLARSGRLGLTVSYLWLPVWIVLRLPGALLALWRAKRDASRRYRSSKASA